MAVYTLTDRSGDKVRVEAPAGLSKEEVVSVYNRRMRQEAERPRRELFEGLKDSFEKRREVAREVALSRKPTIGDYIGEVPKGIVSGAAGLVESGALGVAALLPEEAENVVRSGIQSVGQAVQDYVAPDFNLEESIPRKVSDATGSFVGLLGTSIVNPLAGAGLAVAAGAGEQSERARAEGATQEQRNLASLLGIIPGALELLPIKFIKVLGKEGMADLTRKLTRIVEQGGVEAGQETVTSIANNLIAREVYKPNQDLVEGTAEEAALGGTVGAIVQGTVELFTPRTRRTAPRREVDEDVDEPVKDAPDQGELFPDEDLGRAPERPKPDQGELFPDEDLGEAPERPDPRQGDLFGDAEAAFARRAKAAEREREQLLKRPISKFEKEGDPFFERTKRERDEALSGLAALKAARDAEKRRPAATTRDMRDMVAELQDKQADERAREREGLRAAARGDAKAFDQPDLFAQEIERERRRLGPEELRRSDQFMDDLFFEGAEADQPTTPAAERDLVDLINEESALAREIEAEEAVKRQQEQTKAESAAETAQGQIATGRAAQTEATRTRILQDTVANAGEVRKPKALQNLFEKALADAGLANIKATEQEIESLRRASSAIRAKDPVAEAAAEQEARKGAGQRDLQRRVSPFRKTKIDFTKLDAAKDVKDATGKSTLATSPDDAGLGEGDASSRKSVGTGQEDLQAATGTGAPDVRRLAGDRTDAAGVDAAKEGEPSALTNELFEIMGEEGAMQEYPDVAAAINDYVYNINFKSIENVTKSAEYKQYKNTLQANLKRLFPNKNIPVSRTRGYADPKKQKTKTFFDVNINDIIFVGNKDEKELIIKDKNGNLKSVRVEEGEPSALDRATAAKERESGALKEAEDFLQKLDAAGGAIGSLTNNLRRIMSNVGVTTDSSTTPADAIRRLRNKVTADRARIKREKAEEKEKQKGGFKVSRSERASRSVIKRKYAKLLAKETDKAKRRVLIGQRERELGNLNVLGTADRKSKPVKGTTQRKDTETNFGQALRRRWNKLNKFSSEAVQRESRAGAVDAENRLSNKLNKAIFDKLEETQKNVEIRRYLERYPNVEAAIEDAYIDSLFPPKTGEAGVAPSAAKKVIEFVNINKDANDAKILDELQRNAATAKENIESKRTIDDTLFGEKNANDYARNLVGRIGSLERAMSEGDINGALDVLAKAKDPFIRNMATKFKTLLQGYGVTLKVKKNLTNDIGEAVQGLYDAKTKTIFIDSVKGMDAHTLLHETAHALTVKIATEPMSKLKGPEKAAKKRLKEAYDEARRLLQDPDSEIPTHYGLSDMAEFASEILSNQKFKDILVRRLEGKEETLYDKFKNAVRALVGKPKETTVDDKLNGLIEAILRPDPNYKGYGQYALGNIKDVKQSIKRFGETQRKLTKDFDRVSFVDRAVDFIRNAASKPRKILMQLMANQALGDIAKRYGFGDLGYMLDKAILKQRGAISIATQATKEKVEEVQALFTKMGDSKVDALNQLIYSQEFGATIYQVDPYLSRAEAQKAYGDQQSSDPNRSKMDIWNEQQAYIKENKLRGDAQKAFTLMREHYRTQFERARKTVLNEIDALGKEVDDAELAGRIKNDIYTKLFDAGTLEVYFPLVREGDYKLIYRATNPRSKREEFIVEMFETRDARDRAFREVQEDPLYSDATTADGDLSIKDYQTGVNPNFAYDIVNALQKAKVEPKAIEEVMRVFIATLPETSFAKQLQPRAGTPGNKEDSMYALRTKGYDIAVQSAKLAAASEIRAIEKDITNLKRPDGVPPIAFDDMKAELLSRGQFARQGSQSGFEVVGRRLNQVAFVYTIGFNVSSALVNLSQIPLFVMPYLGAKYGYGKTATAIKKAGGITLNSKNSLRDFYDIDQDGNISLKSDLEVSDNMKQELINIMPLIKEAALRGQLVSQSYLAESMGLDEAARAKKDKYSVGNIMDYTSGVSAYLFNHAEKFNRQNTMIAAYNLHIDKLTKGKGNPTPEQVQEAVNEAIYMTQEANGGAYLETGPSLARAGIGRVALMYKSYGLQMYYSMFKQAKRIFDSNLSKEQRVEAFKVLLGIHGSVLFFAGVQGIPLYGAVKLLANTLFLDDEEEDFDSLTRRNIGEGWYKGPLVALTGLDTASRTALTGLLIQENKYNPDPSLEETVGFYIGGPALSTANRIKRGIEDLGNGFTERGIENLMPTAVANAYKGLYRYQRDEGAITRRGDPIYDDFNWMELLALTGGIQAAGYTQARDITQTLKKIDKKVNNKRTQLARKYYTALRFNDFAEASSIYKEMLAFSRRHPEAAITPEFIQRSLKKHMETSQKMLNGVLLSPAQDETLKELKRGYQDLSE